MYSRTISSNWFHRTVNPVSDDEVGNHPIQGAVTLDTKGSLSGGPAVGLLRAKVSTVFYYQQFSFAR